MPTSASGSYSLPTLRFQNTKPGPSSAGAAGNSLFNALTDMATGIRQARIQGGGGGGTGSITTGQIASFTACVGDVLAVALVGGPGVSLSANAANHTIEIRTATITAAQVLSLTAFVGDALGTQVLAGTNISISVNAANHTIELINTAALTGTITTAQILSFTASVFGAVNGALVAGTNIGLSFNAVTQRTEINATVSGSGTTVAALSAITFTATGSGATPRSALEKMRDVVHVDDFGAVGDGVTDDYAAILRAINSNTNFSRMLRVEFGPKQYRLTSTLNLKRPVHLVGVNGGHSSSRNGTQLTFDGQIDGIVVNAGRTYGAYGSLSASTSSLSLTTDASNSIIEGFKVSQEKSGDHKGVIILDYNPTMGKCLFELIAQSVTGTVTYVDLPAYSRDSTTKVIFGPTTETFGQYIILASDPSGFSVGQTISGATSLAHGVVTYIAVSQPVICCNMLSGTFTSSETLLSSTFAGLIAGPQNIPLYGELSTYIRGSIRAREVIAVSVSSSLGTPNVYLPKTQRGNGITLRSRATIRSCVVDSWAMRGVFIKGDVGADAGTNSNLAVVENTACISNGFHGLAIHGSDANACTIYRYSGVGNGGTGIYDNSFLGTHVFSTHVDSNRMGPYECTSSSNFGVWVGCYSEGSSGIAPWFRTISRFDEGPLILGGDHGDGIGGPTGTDNSVMPGKVSGRSLEIARAIRMPNGLTATGWLDGPVSFRSDTNNRVPISVRNTGDFEGNQGAFYGVDIMVTGDRNNNGDEAIEGGKFGITAVASDRWYATKYRLFTRPDIGQQSLLLLGGVGPAGTSSAGRMLPSISAGVLSGLRIAAFGVNYTVAPRVSGQGAWASFTATTQIFNGNIISTRAVGTCSATVPPPTLCMEVSHTRLQLHTYVSGEPYEIKASNINASATATCDLLLTPSGPTGRVRFGEFTTTATTMLVTGYIEIKDAAGNIRKLAVVG